MRSRFPSSTPAGMRTFTTCSCASDPWPPHSGHASFSAKPLPLQSEHSSTWSQSPPRRVAERVSLALAAAGVAAAGRIALAVARLTLLPAGVADLTACSSGGLEGVDVDLGQDRRRARRAPCRAEAATPPAVAKPVVEQPGVRVGQHRVGAGELAEALLCLRLGGHIWMELAREPAIRLPDYVAVGGPGYAEHLVVVTGGFARPGRSCVGRRHS